MGNPTLLKKNKNRNKVIDQYYPGNLTEKPATFSPEVPYRPDRSVQDTEAQEYYSNWIQNRQPQLLENAKSAIDEVGGRAARKFEAKDLADAQLKEQLFNVKNTPANLYAPPSTDHKGIWMPSEGPLGRIEVPTNTPEEDIGDTMLHERVHAAQPFVQMNKINQLKKEHGYEDTDKYWDSSSEMYSRLMTLRRNLGLQPGQTVTPGMIETRDDFNDPNFVPEKSELFLKSFNELGRANMLKYPKKLLLDMLNKVAENKNTNNPTDPRPLVAQDGRKLTLQTMIATRQKGGLLVGRKKKNSADASFTPEKVQQRVKEYEDVKNKQANKPAATINKPTERYDENEGLSFDKAFAKAKKAGDGTFKWMGKMYNTNSAVGKKQNGGRVDKLPKKQVPKNQAGAPLTYYETIGTSKDPVERERIKNYYDGIEANFRNRYDRMAPSIKRRPVVGGGYFGDTNLKPTDPKYKNKGSRAAQLGRLVFGE